MLVTRDIVVWLFVLTYTISAEMLNVKWRKTFISSGVNPLIAGASEPSKSVLRCSVVCSKNTQFGSFYYSSTLHECYCNIQMDGSAISTTVNTGLIYGIRNTNSQKDCLGLYQQGFTTDGVYVIYPVTGVPVNAWCDMTGGGWTVIQRRQDGSVSFDRLWNDYVNGFGSTTGEYWLGLENMHLLTQDISTLRIELEYSGVTGFAEYSYFAIGSSVTNYQLSVSGFTGNCGDSFSSYHNGLMFSTLDADNDLYSGNCPSLYGNPGWWYHSCWACNLNYPYASGIQWAGSCMSVASKSVMKVKRNV